MSTELSVEKARQAMVAIARRMLSGSTSFIEGARLINQLRWRADLDQFDADILAFIGIEDQTDALPLGEVRRHWAPEALIKLQPEFERLENWARDYGSPSCQKLIDRFGAAAD